MKHENTCILKNVQIQSQRTLTVVNIQQNIVQWTNKSYQYINYKCIKYGYIYYDINILKSKCNLISLKIKFIV